MKIDPYKPLFGKTIIVANSNPETRESIAGALQNFNCKVLLAANSAEAVKLVHTNPQIEVVIIEVPNPISNAFEFMDQIRSEQDDRPPVFFVTEKRDQHFDQAFFEGVEGIFIKPIHFDELVKGVAFSHNMVMDKATGRMHNRRRLRRARVVFTNETNGIAAQGYVTNISSGGLFICSLATLPALEQKLKFKFRYDENRDEPLEFSGRAVVRWLRPFSDLGRPTGFGVEFLELENGGREIVDRLSTRGPNTPDLET